MSEEDGRMKIEDFLLARIAEDKGIARSAIDPERPGSHWHWVTTETDTPVTPGEELEALEHQPISLRTVEEYKLPDAGHLPAFALGSRARIG